MINAPGADEAKIANLVGEHLSRLADTVITHIGAGDDDAGWPIG